MSEINDLIIKVGFAVITINMIWTNFLPVYIGRDFDLYFNFYKFKYKCKLSHILPWFQAIISIKIANDLANA